MSSPTLAHFLNSNAFDADTISRASIELVDTQSGGLGAGDLYADLVKHAKDVDAIDRMLYQLSGDPAYAEQAALIVLSAAWNYPEAVGPIQSLVYSAAGQTATIDADRLATTVLYGMYVLARDRSMMLHDVTYRTPAGVIETQPATDGMTAAELFDAVRDLY